MIKKEKIFVTAIVVLFMSQVFTGLTPNVAADDTVFIIGTSSLVVDLDPHQMWDSASWDMAMHVCEGLLGYDPYDPSFSLIPKLATALGTWSNDNLEYTITLRTGVYFHDGTEFNASAVKWNFDRLGAFIAAGEVQIAELYCPIDEEFVINETVVNSATSVTFKLNYPYAVFEALLAFSGSFIMSPTSTPQDRLITTGVDKLFGTGPYTYSEFIADESNTLEYWPYYWGGTPAIETIKFQIFDDAVTRTQALLDGEIHMGSPMIEYNEQFNAVNGSTHTVHIGPPGVTTGYLGMNNKRINITWREVINYAINYTYIMEDYMEGTMIRLKSPIPMGILYSNYSLDVPTLDLARARQLIIDMGLTDLAVDASDNEWRTLALNDPVFEINYTWNAGNSARENIGIIVMDNLRNVGIKCSANGITWAEYLYRLYGFHGHTQDELSLYFIGWMPDYNDPSNYINPMFSSTSTGNGAQVNDSLLDQWMTEAVQTTIAAERKALYDQIQKRIVEDLYCWALIYTGKGRTTHDIQLTNYPYNAMGYLFLFKCGWQGDSWSATYDTSAPPIVDYEIPEVEEEEEEEGTPGIPGYDIPLMLFAALGAVALVVMKKKQNA
ncbi:MAG: ABC transporter substrate-binding protein [Promethearchaeota archaeon]